MDLSVGRTACCVSGRDSSDFSASKSRLAWRHFLGSQFPLLLNGGLRAAESSGFSSSSGFSKQVDYRCGCCERNLRPWSLPLPLCPQALSLFAGSHSWQDPTESRLECCPSWGGQRWAQRPALPLGCPVALGELLCSLSLSFPVWKMGVQQVSRGENFVR